ncbi:MAG: hypothetical protein Q8R79_01205 [Legionellaceae bacterium]|nr:hypothetical protein [Legionellaceae bacterium]
MPVGTVKTEGSQGNNFQVTFDQKNKVDFYGHEVSPFVSFAMRGFMPDNNVASVKLMNAIGKQLMSLERQEAEGPFEVRTARKELAEAQHEYESRVAELDKIQAKLDALPPEGSGSQADKEKRSNLKRDINEFWKLHTNGSVNEALISTKIKLENAITAAAKADPPPRHESIILDIDKAVNAHTANLLNLMGELEQVRGRAMSTEQRQALHEKIKQAINQTNAHIGTLRNGTEDSLAKARCDQIIKKLDSQRTEFLGQPVLVTEGTKVTIKEHQKIFRMVLQQYQSLENTVSAWEGVRQNRSNTEGYQDASNALEKHVYTAENPTAAQLWRVPPERTSVRLDTAEVFDSGVKRDEVLAAIHIADRTEVNPLDGKYVEERDTIIQRQKVGKALEKWAIAQDELAKVREKVGDDKSPEARDKVAKAERKETLAQKAVNRLPKNALPAAAEKPSAEAQAAELKTQLDEWKAILTTTEKDYIYAHQSDATKYDGKALTAEGKKELSVLMMNKLAAQYPYQLGTVREVHLHESNDLVSAVGHALEVVSSFFSQEMAAKHPGITFAFFTLMSASLGAGAVGALSAHGGMAQHIIMSIEKNWAAFTHSQDSFASRFIMSAVGLPTLSYTMAELLLSKPGDNTTIAKVKAQMRSDELSFSTEEEKMAHTLVQAGMVALALGVVTATGVLTHWLAALPKVASMGPVHAGLSGLNVFLDASGSDFSALTTAHGILPEVIAVASAMFAVKASGLFMGKLYLVGKQVAGENLSPEAEQRMESIAGLYGILQEDGPVAFEQAKAAMTAMYPDAIKNLHTEGQALMQAHPALFSKMPKAELFFAELNRTIAPEVQQEAQDAKGAFAQKGQEVESQLSAKKDSPVVAEKVGAAVNAVPEPTPGLPRRALNAASQGMVTAAKGTWNRLLGPIVAIVAAVVAVVPMIGVEIVALGARGLDAVRPRTPPDPSRLASLRQSEAAFYQRPIVKEMVHQLNKSIVAGSRIGLFFWYAGKTFANSAFGAAVLLAKSAVASVAFLNFCVNRGLNAAKGKGVVAGLVAGFTAGFGALGAKLGLMVTGLGLRVTAGVARGIKNVVKGVVGVLPVVGLVAVGAGAAFLGGIAALVAGAVAAARAPKGERMAAFRKVLKTVLINNIFEKFMVPAAIAIGKGVNFVTTPVSAPLEAFAKAADAGREAASKAEKKLDNALRAEPGAETIIAKRDERLSGLNDRSTTFKNAVGEGLNGMRTAVIRGTEAEIQVEGTRRDSAQEVAWKVAVEEAVVQGEIKDSSLDVAFPPPSPKDGVSVVEEETGIAEPPKSPSSTLGDGYTESHFDAEEENAGIDAEENTGNSLSGPPPQ